MAKTSVALLGLGIMGGGMARRLLGAGFPLTVYNRNPAKAAALVQEGARQAKSPREAAAGADVVLCMVADDAASRSVWLAPDGALAGMKPGAVGVDSGTLTVGWVTELAAAVRAKGCEFLDAPVTGSKLQAAAGEMNFLVGGSAAALEIARPALATMSKNVYHLGPNGSGALLKLINNFMGGVQLSVLSEAIALIERSGLDRTQALEILTNGAAGSPLVKTLAPRMVEQDYTPHFLLRLMCKDLGYGVAEAQKHSLKLNMVSAALDLFKRAVADGQGEKDFSALVELVRKS